MLVKASVSQMCIKKNKKIDVVMKIALSETKAGCKALMTFCPESDFTEELNSKLKDTYLMELSVKREYVYIQHLLILSNSIFSYSCVTISQARVNTCLWSRPWTVLRVALTDQNLHWLSETIQTSLI